MSIRKSSIACLVIGVVLILGAALIRFVAVPTISKLPADLDQSQRYEGTIRSLNPAAFAAGDLANLITPEVPVTADRNLKVNAVDGDVAIVTTSTTINMPQGQTQTDIHTFAVNRVDFSPVRLDDGQVEALVPAEVKSTFEAHDGVAFSFPMDPPKDGMGLYDPVTRTGQPAEFVEEDNFEGRDVYNYEVNASGPIANPAVLAQFKDFPAQLPKAVIAGLIQADIVPRESQSALQGRLDGLPDLVTIGFASTNLANIAVDKQFGSPLIVDQEQGMYVTVPVDGQDVPVLPLSVAKLHTASDAAVSLADTLSSNGRLLFIVGVLTPLTLAVLGLLLLIIAAGRWRKPAPASVQSAQPESELI